MNDATDRLTLPLLLPGQAQKELFHNEALALLDVAVPGVVEAVGLSAPPAAATVGQAWAVGAAPTGDWQGQAGAIAGWTDAGWRFVAPLEGMAVWSRQDGCVARWLAGLWVIGDVPARRVLVDGMPVVGPRQPGIAAATGGTTVDAEARAVLVQVLGSLRAHGLIAPGD